MSNENREAIVHKGRSKERILKDITKRVSFDECRSTTSKINELRILQYGDSITSDQLHLHSLKKLINSYDETEKCDMVKDQSDDSQKAIQSSSSSLIRKSMPVKSSVLSLERGTREGQEDLKRYSSASKLSECGKDSCAKNFVSIAG